MENSENILKKQLRNAKLECIAFKLILAVISPKAIQLYGLMIASLWSYASYKWMGNFKINAPIQFLLAFILVKYYLIPGSKEIISSGYEALEELYLEKDLLELQLQQLKISNKKNKAKIQ